MCEYHRIHFHVKFCLFENVLQHSTDTVLSWFIQNYKKDFLKRSKIFFKDSFFLYEKESYSVSKLYACHKKNGSLTLVIYSAVYCSHFQKDYMLILMVRHYSKLQYPYQISLSKCKMKRVLRRFLTV